MLAILTLAKAPSCQLNVDLGSSSWEGDAHAHSLSSISEHTECFGCAVGQIDTPLNIHFGQKWAAIFHNNTDAPATEADMQNCAKGQSSMGRYKFFVVISLASCQILSSLRWC